MVDVSNSSACPGRRSPLHVLLYIVGVVHVPIGLEAKVDGPSFSRYSSMRRIMGLTLPPWPLSTKMFSTPARASEWQTSKTYSQKISGRTVKVPIVLHPVLGNADAHWRGYHHLGQELFGRVLGHIAGVKGVVDHVQVFVVLFGRGGGHDGGLNCTRLDALAEFSCESGRQQRLVRPAIVTISFALVKVW